MLAQGYVDGACDTPLLGDTIGVHFDRVAEQHAGRPALAVSRQDVRRTYAELEIRRGVSDDRDRRAQKFMMKQQMIEELDLVVEKTA